MLVNVCCTELKGVHFSEVETISSMVKSIGGKGSPLFRGSVIRDFTVVTRSALAVLLAQSFEVASLLRSDYIVVCPIICCLELYKLQH